MSDTEQPGSTPASNPGMPPVPPPPPAAPSSGAPGGEVDVMAGFTYGWEKFSKNWVPFVVGALPYIGVIVVLSILSAVAQAQALPGLYWAILTFGFGDISWAGGTIVWLLVSLICSLASFITLYLLMAAYFRAAVDTTHGREVTIQTFLTFKDTGRILGTAFILALASAILFMCLILPGIAFGFMSMFTMLFVVDKGQSPIDAIKSSFSLVIANIGPAILTYLGVIAAAIVGGILCGVGLLATIPIAYLAVAWVYRRLQGEVVAP